MSKSSTYHRDAVRYNEAVALAAEGVAEELEDPQIKQWATSVGKQHRHHEARHRAALNNEATTEIPSDEKLIADAAGTVEELIAPAPVAETADESQTQAQGL